MKKLIQLLVFGIITPALLSLLTVCDDEMLESIQDEATVMISAWSYFPLSDTGQDIDTGTDGEDMDHTELKPPLFTANDDGTITDQVTGFVWMKCTLGVNGLPDKSAACTDSHGQYSWQDALGACENLDYAGSQSWRVPSITEFMSIFNFRGRNRDVSAVDPIFNERDFNPCSTSEFINTKDIVDYCTADMTSTRRYWTSDRWPKTTSGKNIIWTINTFDGHLNVNELKNNGADPQLYVRCVRSK